MKDDVYTAALPEEPEDTTDESSECLAWHIHAIVRVFAKCIDRIMRNA